MISKKKILAILHSPLVGRTIIVTNHSDPGLQGRKGEIVWESYNLVRIRQDDCDVSIPKFSGTFTFLVEDLDIAIDGKLLLGDAKRRGKRKLRGW